MIKNTNIINYIEVQNFFLIFRRIGIIISIYLLDIYKILIYKITFNKILIYIYLMYTFILLLVEKKKYPAIYYVYQAFLIYDDDIK